jgi:hypothetical protein
MKTILDWLFTFIIGSVCLIVGGLVVNQLEAWLPGLAHRIVRWQARRMGARAAVYEEAWLRDVEDTPGGLAKLSVALGTIRTPLGVLVERYRDEPGGLNRAVALWLWDRASWVVVAAAAAVVVFFYPIERSRFAAYAFLFPLFLFVGLSLVGSFRRACRGRYERLAYPWQILVSGMPILAMIYFAIVLALVPPSFRPNQRVAVARPTIGKPPLEVVLSMPRGPDRNDTKAGNETSGSSGPVEEAPDAHEAPEASPPLPSNRAWPEFFLSMLPSVPLPEQPVPSLQEFTAISGPPVAPSQLRIIQ